MRIRPFWLSWFGAAWLLSCANGAEPQSTTRTPLEDSTVSQRFDVVGILAQNGTTQQLCTGSVLLPNLVLTARHCTTLDRSALKSGDCATAIIPKADPSTQLTVISGEDMDLTPAEERVTVREIWLRDNEGRLCGEDSALLYLAAPLQTKPVEVTRTLPQKDSGFAAVGYGLYNGDWGRQRQNAAARITCIGDDCKDRRIVANEFFAESGVCEGDSGGPAFDEQNRLFALASRTDDDCRYTAYLSLADHWTWLTGAVAQAALEGGYEVPQWAHAESSDAESSGDGELVDRWELGGGGCTIANGRRHRDECWALVLVGIVGVGGRRRGQLHARSAQQTQATEVPQRRAVTASKLVAFSAGD